jgi:hypothetical protein
VAEIFYGFGPRTSSIKAMQVGVKQVYDKHVAVHDKIAKKESIGFVA